MGMGIGIGIGMGIVALLSTYLHVPPALLHFKHSLRIVYLESVIYVRYFVGVADAHNVTLPFLIKVLS